MDSDCHTQKTLDIQDEYIRHVTTIIDNLADISPDLWNNKPLLNLYSINYTYYLHQAPVRHTDGPVMVVTRLSTFTISSKLLESTQDGRLDLIPFLPLAFFIPAHQHHLQFHKSKHNCLHLMEPQVTKSRSQFPTLSINQRKKAQSLHPSQLLLSSLSCLPWLLPM